jgi:hypothetical protein
MSNTKITSHVIESGAVESTHIASGAISASHVTGITTANITENTNLYYTDTRARASISVTGGNLSYDNSTGVLQLTDSEIRDAISATSSGDGSLTYTAGTGVIAYTGPTASEVQAHLSAGTGVTYSGGQISIGQAVGTSDTVSFGNITTAGYLRGPANFTIDPAAYGDDTGTLIIAGNLQVDGTTTTINSTTLTVDDLNLTLASGAANAAAANGAGITVDGASATLLYAASGDKFVFNKGLDVGPITSSGSVIASGNSNSFGNTTITNLSATTVTTSGSVIASGNSNSFGNTTVGTLTTPTLITGAYGGSGSAGDGFRLNSTDLYGQIDSSDKVRLTVNGDSFLTGGNVGIGTASPDFTLDVEADKDTWLSRIYNTGSDANSQVLLVRSDATAAHDATVLGVYADSGYKMVIKSSGNVGIGTLSPTEKLEVVGTALVENAKLKAIAESNTDTAVDVFVYDTRKDSDGGAWRKRTQNTSWYNETLNTSTRGARKEFPSVAVIVAESNQLTIYDGDDPDMPMWMVFNNSDDKMLGSTPTAAVLRDGALWVSLSGYGVSEISFVKDEAWRHRNNVSSAYYGRFNGGIVYRNVVSTFTKSDYIGALVNGLCNDIAITVLPNAPIDADTGLPVPTIAVATQGGISIIKDTGTVVDINVASGGYNHITDVDISPEGWVAWSHSDTRSAKAAPIPDQDKAYGFWTYADGAYNFYESHAFASNLGNVPALVSSGGGITDHIFGKVVSSSDGLTLIGLQKSEPAGVFGDVDMPLSAYITSDYNTGWMVGDTKLATLSDTDTTNAGAEIVTNGDFATDSGWTKGAGWTISGGKATHDSTTGNRYLTQGGILTAGKQYVLTFTISNYTSGTLRIYGGTTQPVDITEGNATYTIPFIAAAGGDVNFQSSVSGAFIGSIDNVSCKLAEQDRSYNANGLQVFGTVTKTAVATGAELVAYSGFSSSNALQTSYSSSYAVGTEFSASMWLKGGADSQTPFAVESTTANDTDSTILIHTHPSGFYFYTRGANDASWGTSGAASIQSTSIGLSEWHMVTISQDAAGRKLYIDGKLNASDAVVKTIDGVEGTLVVNVGGRPPNFFQNYTGKISLVRFSGTPATPEQVAKMYNDEKHLFATNAKATLYGTSNNPLAIAYDDDMEQLHAGTSAGRSVFQGLNRVDNTTDAVGVTISASNGLVAED